MHKLLGAFLIVQLVLDELQYYIGRWHKLANWTTAIATNNTMSLFDDTEAIHRHKLDTSVSFSIGGDVSAKNLPTAGDR